jgi:hypothetical protein
MVDPTHTVTAATRRWIADVVIGLNLCPFARRPFDADRIRYAVSDATDESHLVAALDAELTLLVATPRTEIETSLLILPYALPDFRDFNDFVGVAEQHVESRGLTGVVQLATFHPRYQFADTDPEAVENYTNRSPYPMLHLLREVSVTEVAGHEEFVAGIPQRNIALLRRLGLAAIRAKLPPS